MSDFSSILKGLANSALALLPKIVPGAAPVIAAGKSLSDAIASLTEAHTGAPVPEATAAAEDLMAKVNAHAQATFDRAENGG